MWRSAFVGLALAVVIVVGWNQVGAQTTTDSDYRILQLEQRVSSLEIKLARLERNELVWKVAPRSEVWGNAGFFLFDEENTEGYIYYQYCQIESIGPEYITQYELRCMKVDPES